MVKKLTKTVATFSSALLFSTLANAVEVFNKDGSDLTFGGRVLLGTETNTKNNIKFNDDTGAYNSLRFNIAGNTQLQDDWKGFVKIEYQLNFDPDQSWTLNPRVSYIGLKNTNWSLSFGKQFTPYYDVTIYTENLQNWGGEASTFRFGTLEGTERVSKSAVLRYTNGGLELALMGSEGFEGEVEVLNNTDQDTVQPTTKYEYAGSAQYALTEGFKLGASFSVTQDETLYTDTTIYDSSEINLQRYLYGASYTVGDLSLGLVGIAMQYKETGFFPDTVKGRGAEAYVGYKLTELGNSVYAGYNYLDVDSEYKLFNYVAIGYTHYFAANLYAFAEYKWDVRTDAQAENVKEKNSSALAAYIRYAF